MTRTEHELVDQLIAVCSKHHHHVTITQEDFKKIAQKDRLRTVFIENITLMLRPKGYILIDLREEKNCITVMSIEFLMRFVQADVSEFALPVTSNGHRG